MDFFLNFPLLIQGFGRSIYASEDGKMSKDKITLIEITG